MEISPSRSSSFDLDKTFGPSAVSYFPSTYENCRTNMYAMPDIKSCPEAKIQKSYAMQSLLSNDPSTKSVAIPKKGNFFTSMFGALASIVAERLSKVPSSFVSNINNSLSVTVVPNEGIISQDFFKNLTRSCEQLTNEKNNDIMENSIKTDKLPIKTVYKVESPVSHIFTDKTRKYSLSSKVSLNIECEKTHENDKSENFDDTRLSDCPVIITKIFNELDEKIVNEESRNNRDLICNEMASTIINDSVKSDKVLKRLGVVVNEDSIETRIILDMDSSSRSAVPRITNNQESMEISDQTCAFGWQTMWDRVKNGMSERFSSARAVSPDSEVVPTKKPNLSKTSRRKVCTIARGRGKGRGKSQLRRNGVSQSRHRKERTKHEIYSSIKDDLNDFEDSEGREESEDDDSSLLINERKFDQQCASSHHCLTLLESLSFDVTSGTRKRKQEMPNNGSKCPMRVTYVPESTIKVKNHDTPYIIENDCSSKFGRCVQSSMSESSDDSDDSCCIVFKNVTESKNHDSSCMIENDNTREFGKYRQRSMSESSDESDDSCCIVFKNGSELENHDSPYIIENVVSTKLGKFGKRSISESSNDTEDSCSIVFENGSESDYTDDDGDNDGASDTVSDDDSDDNEKSTQTVRFNLKPEVHKMIKWDYAYRSARRGPWERMARDRERFGYRIHRTETILNPILSVEHRNLIWQKRFDFHEESGQSVQTFLTNTR